MIFDFKILASPDNCQWSRYQRDLVAILHCKVSSEAQYETWWWSSARAETCCLSNKNYSTTLL